MKPVNSVIRHSIAIMLLITAPLTLQARGDATAGQQKSKVCEACHGPTGESIDPIYPKLAGQYPSYIVQALRDYRSGRRNNPIMGGFAANLSNQDMEDLAAWYSSQEGLVDLKVK